MAPYCTNAMLGSGANWDKSIIIKKVAAGTAPSVDIIWDKLNLMSIISTKA